jgi:hypothetical protein
MEAGTRTTRQTGGDAKMFTEASQGIELSDQSLDAVVGGCKDKGKGNDKNKVFFVTQETYDLIKVLDLFDELEELKYTVKVKSEKRG